MHRDVLPEIAGDVQLTVPPGTGFAAAVTTKVRVKVAVTVQFAVSAAVLNGDDALGEPQLLVATPVNAYPLLAVAVQFELLPKVIGDVQVSVPPPGGVATAVTTNGSGVNAAVTVQSPLSVAVTNGWVLDCEPQLLVMKLLKVNPELAVALHVDVASGVVGWVQVTVPPAGGAATAVTVGSTRTLANVAA